MRNDSPNTDPGNKGDWVAQKVSSWADDYRPGVVRSRVRTALEAGLGTRKRPTRRRAAVAAWGACLAIGLGLIVWFGLGSMPSTDSANNLPGILAGPAPTTKQPGPADGGPEKITNLRHLAQSAVGKYTPVRAWSGVRGTASDLNWVHRTIRPLGRSFLPVRPTPDTDGPGA